MDATVLRRVGAGVVAGTFATAVMSGVLLAGERLGLLGEPPPRKLVRGVLAKLSVPEPAPGKLDLAALIAHFGYGASMGALFGLLPPGARPAARGALFGLGVWAVSYQVWIPALGLMPPPSRDKPGRPTVMVLAHLVYGAAMGLVQDSLAEPRAALL